ncbi:MAG: DEAD/DEAH box helicase, partial [Kiritimatiellae bacterium]|nr:DEAD/DEAH box helicase [Kiritimatiellia bacterium]
MTKKSLFKTDFVPATPVSDPETLFRDLRGRSPEIRHLWSHQADLLRAYHRDFLNNHDLAIELPTGAGKTLVGLLIAEFRRQAFNERVVYLCPTRQLARQVGTQAAKYGIKANVLVGKQREYPPREFSEFQTSRAVAITTYSGIFNLHPRISDAQAIILDDAHAGENYIAGHWSMEISRADNRDLYRAVVALFRDGLPPAFLADLADECHTDKRKTDLVELVPGYYVRNVAAAFGELLDAGLQEETPPRYAWGIIKEHLAACCIFVSWDSILVRPHIPPALTHRAFAHAKQRVYMSATLGAGGELERVTGIKSIARIPIPAGWEKRGSGRRLFLVPQMTMAENDAMGVVLTAVSTFPRCLVLTPRTREAEPVIAKLRAKGVTIFGAFEIEDSIEPFAHSTNSALVLSRYDGLDLPDETCRILVMCGLPSGTNLQEKFLWSRIAAHSLLRDRVLTRFTQGIGRCTRSDNDYAVVILWGRHLVDFILKDEHRRILNPELQAEIQFGIDNSSDKSVAEFQELWTAFIAQGDEWKEAEDAIVSLRERCSRRDDPVSERLRSVVADEVGYLNAMWNGSYEIALEHARKVADALGGDETKGYRAWWYYLAADVALALHRETSDSSLVILAKDFLGRASGCCSGVSWFARLARFIEDGAHAAEANELTAMAVANVQDKLIVWGVAGSRFDREAKQALDDLSATEFRQFHRGLKALGEMLGFEAEALEGEANPDCIWSLGDEVHVVH